MERGPLSSHTHTHTRTDIHAHKHAHTHMHHSPLPMRLPLVRACPGDSRAVLARGKHAVRITRDHKPELRSEKLRIEGAGGKVQFVKGSWRVLLPCQNSSQTKICATSR
jgi:serine/threonine protein phosphatase PrpC